MDGTTEMTDTTFVWRRGGAEVSVVRTGDSWNVVYISVGPLLGPPQVLHDHKHKDPLHAAWDVLNRVKRAAQDEDEGVRVASVAARWMRDRLRSDVIVV